MTEKDIIFGVIVVICLMTCYSMARTMYRDQRSLKKAFCCGLLIGCAIIAEWWVCFVFPALIWYLYTPMKINNLKVFYSTTLGVLTPLWIMLPYWIFV